MTDSELVTLVFDKLIAQGGCSTDSNGNCMYRSPDGRKCAAGLLIKDRDYDKEFENILCHPVQNTRGRKLEISIKISNLLKSYGLNPRKIAILQGAHDRIATRFNNEEHIQKLTQTKAEYLAKLDSGLSLLEIQL